MTERGSLFEPDASELLSWFLKLEVILFGVREMACGGIQVRKRNDSEAPGLARGYIKVVEEIQCGDFKGRWTAV